MLFRAVALLFLSLMAACASMPPPPPAPPRATNMELQISSVTLDNGLRVALVRDPRAAEVSVTMRYAVGAIDDPADQAGIAHLVEHLMFQQIVGAQSIFAKLESTAREFNALTTFDATTYITRAPADRLDALLSIEAVRMNLRCTSISEAVFTRERAVVINEVRMRDRSTEMVAAFDRGAYPEGHPYTAAVGGTVASVGAITMKQACAFADAHYGPSNAVLVVSGNIETAAVEASLTKFMQRIPRRALTAPRAVAAPGEARAVETNAPLDDDAVLVAWPLPEDPELRARLTAIGGITASYINSVVKGRVTPLLLGDTRAQQFAVLISRDDDETPADILKNVEKAIDEVPDFYRVRGILGTMLFNRLQQGAIYQAFAGLEEGSNRDIRLAADVLAGRPPDRALGVELQSLRSFTTQDALALTARYFAFSRANIAVLKASESTRGSTKLAVATPIHDLGQRRDPPDPAEALQPAIEPLGTWAPQGMTTRTLPNGMRVILLPLTSVPTVDMRLVFGAGTADELATSRGAAIVATKGLDWSTRYLNDAVNMAVAGGSISGEVGEDSTVFSVQGLDMHVDYLLAGLRRIVREGRYNRDTGTIVEALRDKTKDIDDEGALTDAWRDALFGTSHPYRDAGISRHVSPRLSIADAEAFRAAHFAPNNATLVIAGRFDPALTDRWIDYLFADWRGTAAPRTSTPAAVQPVSIAKDDDIAQIQLRVALPARGGTRAQRLVMAEMLADIARDVRHQLGAAYSLGATYSELRQSSLYAIDGAIDAARTHESLALIKARIDQLHADKDAAARAFVAARRRLLSTLTATTRSAANLASVVTDDVTLGRAPLSDVQLATEVHALTISSVTDALADLDLSYAAILMRGPAADVDRAFAVLGRKPTRITADTVDTESPFDVATPVKLPDEEVVLWTEIEDALTSQQRRRITYSVTAVGGYATGKVTGHGVSGPVVNLAAMVRLDLASIGARISVASLDGVYPLVFRDVALSATPVSAGLYLQTTAIDRVWGGASVGVDFVQITDDTAPTVFRTGFNIGVEGGVDVLRFGTHRITLFGRVETELGSISEYTSFSFGAGYRRH